MIVIYFVIFHTLVYAEDICSIGSYRSEKGPWDKCSGFRICEKGYYCERNKKYECPIGFYGNTTGN